MHRLTEADREVQAAARTFADELIPYEVEAELAGGELAPEVAERHRARARELGLTATNIADRVRRPRAQHPAAGARPGAGRPGHQRAGLVHDDAPRLAAGGRHAVPARAVARAVGPRRRPSSATPSPRSSPAPTWPTSPPPRGATATTTCSTARSGTSRRTTRPPTRSSRPGWSAATTRASTRCSSWTCPAPASAWCAPRRTRTPSGTSTRSSRSRACGCRRPTWSARRATA